MEPEETKQFRLHWKNADNQKAQSGGMETVGLAYFTLFLMIFGSAWIAIVLLKLAWRIWKKARFKILAIIPLLLGGFCAFVALYSLAIIWREGLYYPF